MCHDDEPLILEVVKARSADYQGPIPEFLAKKQAEQREKTVRWYREALYGFHSFLLAKGSALVGDVTSQAGHQFILHLREQGNQENTINNRVRALKVFTRWMAQRGWTGEDRFADVKPPQYVRPRFEPISRETKQALVRLFDPETFLGSRDLAVICLLADTGVRLGELCELRYDRVYLQERNIHVYAPKTRRWRFVPFSDVTAAVVQNYLKWRQKYLERPHRFRQTGSNGRRRERRQLKTDTLVMTWRCEKMTGRAVQSIIARAKRKLGVKKLHPHLFRHTYATEKALDREPFPVVMRWMGHKSTEMTEYYFDLADEKFSAIRPQRSALEGVSVLPKKSRTRQR